MVHRIGQTRVAALSARSQPDPGKLRIEVIASAGEGRTPLSAFDAALHHCGTHDYNLLPLSSVIPPGAEVVACGRYQAPVGEQGHKLYVVRAEVRSAQPGAVVAAGLGWLQQEDGRGVFVEHEVSEPHGACAEVERTVAEQITASLRDLAARRGFAFVPERVGSLIAVARVERQPACALAIAVYQSEGWR